MRSDDLIVGCRGARDRVAVAAGTFKITTSPLTVVPFKFQKATWLVAWLCKRLEGNRTLVQNVAAKLLHGVGSPERNSL